MTATAAAGSKEATLIDAIFLKPSDQSTTFNDDYTYFSIQYGLSLNTQLTFAAYMIGATAFWGNFMFLFFVSTGLIAIPFENIIAWVDQPKPMKDEADFKKEKD